MAPTVLSATAVIASLGTLVLLLFMNLPDAALATPAGVSFKVPRISPRALTGGTVRYASRKRSDAVAAPPSTWLEQVTKKKIIVHMLDDKSIEGVLMEQTEDGVILRAAKLLGENHAPDVQMAGEVFVPRSNVAFAQLDE